MRNHEIKVRIARYHNIFGPEGAWNDGKEKAPAAICRKVAMADDGGEIQIWGDGKQTRSFLYIDECLDGTPGSEVWVWKLGHAALGRLQRAGCRRLGKRSLSK